MGGSDNVVRPVFGAKPQRAESTPQTVSEDEGRGYESVGPLTGDALVQAQRDLVYLLQNMDYANRMRDRLEELGDIVFGLANFTPDTRSIDLRRQGLRTQSLEEICNMAENVTELQAKMQPSYLGALTLEHAARLNAALSLMDKAGDGK